MAITFSGSGAFRQGSITFDADAVVQKLDSIRRVQMPFVLSYALNRLGPVLQSAHRQEMQSVFRAPVPFTLNSIFYTKSSKDKLYSYIGVKDFAGKGNAAAEYLFPQVSDNGASAKPVFATRFSKGIRRKNAALGAQAFFLPIKQSAAARLNSYGNITPGQYTQVLYSLGVYSNDTFTGKRYANAKRPPKKEYFLAPPGNQLGIVPGIYRRKDMQMLFKYFSSPPTVRTRYDFYGLTDRTAQQEFPRLVNEKLASLF